MIGIKPARKLANITNPRQPEQQIDPLAEHSLLKSKIFVRIRDEEHLEKLVLEQEEASTESEQSSPERGRCASPGEHLSDTT